MATITLDPSRLTALDRVRAAKRAQVAGMNEAYHAKREALTDVVRRQQQAAHSAEWGEPRNRTSYLAQVDALATEAAAIREEMSGLQAELSASAAEAAEAGRLFEACLKFASQEGLDIPRALATEAQIAIGNIVPARSA